MFESHSYFETPEDNTIVWRYMTFDNLKKTLGGTLWFNRCDCFKDRNEGRMPAIWANSSDAGFRRIITQVWEGRRECFINCWTAHPYESVAMWNMYAKPNGVAIRSSVGRIKRALYALPLGVFIGAVKYVDYDTWSDSPLCNNWLQMIPFKGLHFRHEEEIRLVVSSRLSDESGDVNRWRDDVKGHALPIDLNELIDCILVHPDSSDEASLNTRSLLNQFQLGHKEVVKSTLTLPFSM